ncbi:MAG: helicase-associated domain-containing protein [Brevinematales bacterium]|nr:helicase-associated domain-containing protein [Brevinematales bacterium]
MFEVKNEHQTNEEEFVSFLSKSESSLVKAIYDYYLGANSEISFDSLENKKKLLIVEEKFRDNITDIINSLNSSEKLILEIMKNSYGWLVYDSLDNLTKLISKFFGANQEDLKNSLKSLMSKYIIFNYKRLNHYNFIFCPQIFLKYLYPYLQKEFAGNEEENKEYLSLRENLIENNYLQLIAGFISYIVNYSPRSSENNEIHKIDFEKLLDFFSDFAEKEIVTKIIKRLSKFGFFQKFNNRIVINKFLFESITRLSVNEQFFIIFIYEFLDQFGFNKPAFITLKILAQYCFVYKKAMPLKDLFLYYLNSHFYFLQKNETTSILQLIKHEELKFMLFIKQLENYKIAKILSKNGNISLFNDRILINEPILSILNNIDLSDKFSEEHFVIDSNYEVIVEPNIKPEVLFKLALFTEPKTIQVISIFKLTKDSIKKSLAYGIKKEEILEFLKNHSTHKIPENVEQMIKTALDEVKFEQFANYKIIQINAHFSNYIREKYKNSIIEIEPHTFLIFEDDVLKQIENYCNENKIQLKYITDFLAEKYNKYITKYQIERNIKHLHTIKDFFDFYGTQHTGTIIKIENQI